MLELINVEIQRLRDITLTDCLAEGMSIDSKTYPKDQFENLWDHINGHKSNARWKDNPWVWMIDFKVLEGGSYE